MKLIILFIFMVIIVSCSGQHIKREIKDPSWDSFSSESFMRMDDKRLKRALSLKENAGCYQGEIEKTLYKLKDAYIQQRSDSYWLDIGTCYFLDSEYEKAEFFYRQALSESKTNSLKAVILNNLGLVYVNFGLWEKAHDFFNQSISLESSFRVPRFNLALLYLQFGLYDKTISILSSNSFQGLHDVDIYLNLASAYLFKGDFVKADEFFKLIPRESFKREDVAAVYSLLLLEKGNMLEAAKVLDQREESNAASFHLMAKKIEKLIALKLNKD
jgi:tetratricopeptide (TPR) repeat protein